MKMNELMQVIMLAQDAKEVGWDFVVENNELKAVDGNFAHDPVVFKSEDQLLEWLEDQFDAEA